MFICLLRFDRKVSAFFSKHFITTFESITTFSNSVINLFCCWNHSVTIVLITRVEKRSQFPLELYMFCIIRSAKTSCASFEECYTILFRVFCALRNWNFYVTTFITSSGTLPKREAAILKFGAPAISASREVIIARFDAILDKSERTHLYNDWSNNSRGCYSGSVTWILTWILVFRWWK